MIYDVLIIGAGPAGLSAAIYACRKKLRTLVISVDVGGQANIAGSVENYPGAKPMSGLDLAEVFHGQAEKFGAELEYAKVTKVSKAAEGFVVDTAKGCFEAKAVILAFGKVPRLLGIPGESEFLGKGVATCVTCDAPLFKNKVVLVVGGGNSAVQGALELAGVASKVYLAHYSDEFRADAVLLEKLKQAGNAELMPNTGVREIRGEKFVKSVVLETGGEKRELQVSGVFIEIGYVVDAAPVKELAGLNERNEVVIDENGKTSVEGLFAAGDCSSTPYKQIVTAAGEGAKAALSAYAFLTGSKVKIDWGH